MCTQGPPIAPPPSPTNTSKVQKVGFLAKKNVLHLPNWVPKFVSNFLLNPKHSSSAFKQTHTRHIYGLQILLKQTSITFGN